MCVDNQPHVRKDEKNVFCAQTIMYSVQTIMGVTLAGLAEGMALADRAGLQQKDVMEVN